MAVTLGSTGITFPDATTQTTAATSSAPTTAQVLTATAGATAGAVGTYVLANYGGTPSVSLGSNISGSLLNPANCAGSTSGTVSGTWKLMGYIFATGTDPNKTSLLLRIA